MWADTFAGVDRRLLQSLSQSPAWDGQRIELGHYGANLLHSSADDERRLSGIGRAVDHFFDRCEDTARHTDQSVRCWLRSHIPKRPYKAPFELPGRRTTTIKYRSLWRCFLYFVIRLYRLDSAACDAIFRRRLSEKRKQAIGLLWTATHPETSGVAKSWSADQLHSPDGDEFEVARDAERYGGLRRERSTTAPGWRACSCAICRP